MLLAETFAEYTDSCLCPTKSGFSMKSTYRSYGGILLTQVAILVLVSVNVYAQLQTASDQSEDKSGLIPNDGSTLYDREHEIIGYNTSLPNDAIAQLQARLVTGQLQLQFDQSRGYLDSLLESLGIDKESQLLVFSRTSLNFGSINPLNPRAIYFNDDTYLAWIPGTDDIEIASMDSDLGPVFYTLKQARRENPGFVRHASDCLRCHDSLSLTGGGVPRFLLGSGYINESGNLVSHEGWIVTNQTTPLRFRWGGWYVTGKHGAQVHLGNIVVKDPADLQYLENMRQGNLDNLDSMLSTDRYPGKYSDIVALMVIEHQVHMQNLITRVNYDARKLLHNREAGELSDADLDAISDSSEALVSAMFMVNEAAITDKISGNTSFRDKFEARGPFDQRGRSLRQLDLEKRLLRYPLSYLIYSEAYANLPEVASEKINSRIKQVLNGEDSSGTYAHLSEADRTAILEILNDTLPGFM